MGEIGQDSAIRESLLGRNRREGDEGIQIESEEQQGLWEELQTLVSLCGPAVVQLCAQQAAIVSNQMFAGSLGKHELAAASLGFTVSSTWCIARGDLSRVASRAAIDARRAHGVACAILSCFVH